MSAQEVQAQDGPVDVEAIDRELEVARSGRPQIRPQAARRLVKMGPPAVERVLEVAGEGSRGLAELGTNLVEVLGQFGDARLRARLWEAVEDADFPWRPAASRSLGTTAVDGEAERFAALLRDPLAAVRAASLSGFRALDLKDRKAELEAVLEDPDDRVRRAAAALLDEWGEAWALAWLLEDLRRVDEYFGRPHGRSARYASLKILEQRLGAKVGFHPGKDPGEESNRAAWKALRATLSQRAQRPLPDLPVVARAGPRLEGEVLGLEVSSCRRGEFVLRWCADDRLHVGVGNPATVELTEGSVASLRARAQALIDELGRSRVHGQPGCDTEVYHFRLGEGRPVSISLSKGPDAVEDLRPDPVHAFAELLLQTLPEEGADPRLAGLRSAVTAAVESVGGRLR